MELECGEEGAERGQKIKNINFELGAKMTLGKNCTGSKKAFLATKMK